MSTEQTDHSTYFRRLRHRRPALALLTLITVLLAGLAPVRPAMASDGQGTNSTVVRKVYFPTVSYKPTPCFTTHKPSIFGVQMYGNTGADGDLFNPMQSTNSDWIRVHIKWADVEPENTSPARYKWRTADAAVAAALDGCKRVIVTHRGAPDWAAKNPDSVINPANEADFVEYIGSLVERYDADGIADAPGAPLVLYWELYNEPDATDALAGVEGWGNHPQNYARVMEKAYGAIKAANPQAQLLFGGLAFDWFEADGGAFVRSFVDRVLAIDQGQHFDIFNFHAYPAFGKTWILAKDASCTNPADDACLGPGLYEKYQYMVQDVLHKHGITGKPIIITESGWHSNREPTEPSTEEVQSRYVTELFVQSKAAGAEAMMYFSLVDPDRNPFASGLYTNPSGPGQRPRAKVALEAYTAAVAWLSEATFVRRLNDSELGAGAMDAYEFRSAAGATFYVAWLNPAEMGEDLNGDGKPDIVEEFESLRLAANHAFVYNNRGEYVQTITDNDGDIRVLIGGQPMYIHVIN